MGGSVTDLGGARFLVSFIGEEGAPTSMSKLGLLTRLEHAQVELARCFVSVGNRCAMPVVTVDPVRHGGFGAGSKFPYPEEVERAGPLTAQVAMPQSDMKWRLDYERDMGLAVAFNRAIAERRAALEFQPIVRRDRSEQLLYSEALLRVSGLPFGAGTGHFIPVLERFGLVRAVDRLVVLAVLGQLKKDHAARLGCNVSARSLVIDSWWLSIFDYLADHPDLAARLTIEITETAPIGDFDAAIEFVNRLMSLGCRISLDDFGVGYSSLAFARAVQPHVIKLDKSWLRDGDERDSETSLLSKFAAFCNTLAPCVVAEGIESEDDLEKLAKSNVAWIQGEITLPLKARDLKIVLDMEPVKEA